MIRNPIISNIINFNEINNYDIIVSRDHGPGKLEFSKNWGNTRLCTGFLYLRYSQYLEEFVKFILQRCKLYGHDQIQFNKVCSRSSLIWQDSPYQMNNDNIDHYGYLPWFSPSDPDFIVINDSYILSDWKLQSDTINYIINNDEKIIQKYNEIIRNKIITRKVMIPYKFHQKLNIKGINIFIKKYFK